MHVRFRKLTAQVALKSVTLLAFVSMSFMPAVSRAQAPFTIKIAEPAEGANISGPFTLTGTTTVPFENSLALKVFSTSTNEQLISQPLPVKGQVGQEGTFRVVLNYNVGAATSALIQILYLAPKDGSVTAKAEVRVVLNPYQQATPVAPVSGDAALSAVQLALADYEGRVQSVTPIPSSVEDRTFADGCLGLTRPGEVCTQGQIAGKVVKLSFGGATFTYHVGNNQARLNQAESSPINQQGGPTNIPKPMAEAAASTSVKLYIPSPKLKGPFEGLFFRRVDWENGIVTMVWGADNNPIDIKLTERIGSAAPAPSKPSGQNIQLGTVSMAVQVDAGRKYVEWVIQGTVVNLSVPQSISDTDLAALANGLVVPGGQAGQANLLDRTQFTNLTLGLPEPSRSAEMARQALMALAKPVRAGAVIAIQMRQFNDACLGLGRQGEACAGGAAPGYVIGIADSELYRYHVANGQVRLNRQNSELINKTGADFATVDAAHSAVPFALVGSNDPNVTLFGIQVSQIDNAPVVLVIYRDNKTGGVFALSESASGNPSVPGTTEQITVNGAQIGVKSDPNGRTVNFSVQSTGTSAFVTLWASPEIGVEDLTRIANSMA